MASRGVLADINRARRQAEVANRQRAAAAARASAAAQRQALQLQREAERAHAAAQRADAAARREAEREAARLHAEARAAETEALNVQLSEQVSEIDTLLSETLNVDDYVSLDDLKRTADLPPFLPGRLAEPLPSPEEPMYPPEPRYVEPTRAGAMARLFESERTHELRVARAREEHAANWEAWRQHCSDLWTRHEKDKSLHRAAEVRRKQDLDRAMHEHREECQRRVEEAQRHNAEIDKLKSDLAFDIPEAIEEYVGLVLGNSVYPDAIPVAHEASFNLDVRELNVVVSMPAPQFVPTVKEYRYVKTRDEITPVAQSQKAIRDRYANAVFQVALRTLHEIFEADRLGKIRTIALTVTGERVSPATGLPEVVPLVVAGAAREDFMKMDLAHVVPQATLEHLGAALSKNAYDMTPASETGIRTRKSV